MKLSIWQQFSSNHSSSFTVVGEFATRIEAEKAADKIREILQGLDDWHTQHEEEMDDWWRSGDWANDPSPFEKDLAAQYNIEWRGAIDWFREANVRIVLDRLLYITPGSRPEADGQPFDQLINRLGGKGYHEGNVYGDDTGWILFNLTCQTPDESIATEIYKRRLGFNRRIKRNGTQLNFYRWRFDEHPELPTLIAQLEAYGCTGIEYNFEQIVLDRNVILYGPDDLEVLIDVLKNVTDYDDRQRSAEALGEIGDTRAVEPLIEALQDSNEDVRRESVRSLGDLKDKRAVDPLLPLLKEAKSWTKSSVIEALGKIADPRAIRPLIDQLGDEHHWQEVVAVLGRIGAPALEPLQAALANANPQARNRIESALQRIKDTVQGGQQLADMRNEDEAIAQKAFEEVRTSGDIETMLAFLRNPGTSWRSNLPNQVIDTLIELKEERLISLLVDHFSSYGQTAIIAFTKIDAPAVDALIKLEQSHPEPWIRQSILHALATIGDPRAFDLLIKALDSLDNITRRIAAVGLGKIGDHRAAEPLIHAYFRSQERWHPETEMAILQSIQFVGGQTEFVDALIAQLQTSGHAFQGAVYRLGELGDKRAIEPLKNMLGSAQGQIKEIIENSLRKLEQ